MRDTRAALNAEDLEAVKAWAEAVLNEYKDGRSAGIMLCGYIDNLPTHSVRSTMLSLVAEVERLRAASVSTQEDDDG